MRTVPLQQYLYDDTGQLRNTYDPRLDYTSGGNTLHVATAYTYNTDRTIATLTPPGEQAWSFTYTTIPTDTGAGRLYKISRSALAAGTSVQTIVYNVSISGSSAPVDMAANVARWGQTSVPVDATSVYPGDIVPDGNPSTGTPPTFSNDDRVTVYYMNPDGRQTNAMEPGGATSATFYDQYGNVVRDLTAGNLARALYASGTDTPGQEAALANAESVLNIYSNDGSRLLETLAPEQDTVLPDWSNIRGRTHTTYAYDEGAPGTGGPYNLVTSQAESVRYTVNGSSIDADRRNTSTTYDWTLRQPTAVTVDPSGLALTSRSGYDSNGVVTSTTSPAGDAGGTTPYTRKTVYYRSGTGSGTPECDSHPEWSLFPCKTYAASQPALGNEIPFTITTYDLYGQTRVLAEKNSSGTLRTTTIDYDIAGRPSTVNISSPLGTAVAAQRSLYDQAAGYLLTTQALDTSGNVTASVGRGYDTLGRQISYTDADNNTSTMTYDLLSRILTTSDGKASRMFTYNGAGEKRGLPTQISDGQAGNFTATYNTDGAIHTETRPDGLTVRRYYDENGRSSGIEYATTPTCSSSSCILYYDYVGNDTHGKTRWDSSSFSSAGYGYDDTGRLTGARQTASAACTLRNYAFDNSANRTRLTSYGPDGTGNCQDNNPTTVRTWAYDTADRINSSGYSYDTAESNGHSDTEVR